MQKTKKHLLQQKPRSKKLIFIALLILVLLAGGIFIVADPFGLRNGSETIDETINLDPPTEEDRQAVDEHKESIELDDSEGNNQDSDSSDPKEVKPFITIAQQFDDSQYGNRVEVRAYVQELVESGGKCKITLTKDDESVVWEVDAVPDASTTVCDTAMIPRSEFPSAGSWTTVVAYESPTATGSSSPVQVEVE